MKLLCWIVAVLLSCCGFAQDRTDSVVVLPKKIAAPASAKKLGTISVGNNSTAINCDYEKIIAEAKKKGAEMGGNIVKITELVPPAFVSKCYRIKADVYYSDSLQAYQKAGNTAKQTTVENNNFATLYIYRLHDTLIPEPTYKLHLDNDSVICNVKGKWKQEVRIYKDGPITLWAKTEKREELKLDIKTGSSYYVRCGLRSGQFWMTPVIELVDPTVGATEYGRLNKGKNGHTDTDIHYLDQIH